MKDGKRDLPLIETTFSLLNNYLAALLFLVPAVSDPTQGGVYANMAAVAPAPVWGAFFLAAGIGSLAGLITGHVFTRRTALATTAFLYGVVFICYAMEFPNLGTGVFAVLTYIAFESRDVVKKSEL